MFGSKRKEDQDLHAPKRQKQEDNLDSKFEKILTKIEQKIKERYQDNRLSLQKLIASLLESEYYYLRGTTEQNTWLRENPAFINAFFQKLKSIELQIKHLICDLSTSLDETNSKRLIKLLIQWSCDSFTLETPLSSVNDYDSILTWIDESPVCKWFDYAELYKKNIPAEHQEKIQTVAAYLKRRNTDLVIAELQQNPQRLEPLYQSQIEQSRLEEFVINAKDLVISENSEHLQFRNRWIALIRFFNSLRNGKKTVIDTYMAEIGYDHHTQKTIRKEKKVVILEDRHLPPIINALLQNKQIISLDLSGNRFTTKALQALWQTLPELSELAILNLSNNQLDDDAAVELCKVIKSTKIHELYLQNNQFSDKGILAITEMLETHRYLCKLNLSVITKPKNPNPGQQQEIITNVALLQLANVLKNNKTLVELLIMGWHVDESAIKQFLNEIKQNTSLLELQLYLPETYEKYYDDERNNYHIRRENDEKKRKEDARQKTIESALKKNRDRQARFCGAVMQGKAPELQNCFREGSSLYTFQPSTKTYAFHIAIREKKQPIIKIFCERQINPNLPTLNSNGSITTPLDLCQNNPDIVELLQHPLSTQRAAKPVKQATIQNFFNKPDAKPEIEVAAAAPIVPVVIEPITDMRLRNAYLTHTGELKIETLSIEDMHYKYPDGKTLLHIAVEQDQLAIVQGLLEKGAEVNAIDSWSRTALYYACMPPYHENSVAIVEALLAAKAQINIRDKTNRSVIFHLASINSNILGASESMFYAIAKQLVQRMQAAEQVVYDPISDIPNCPVLHISIMQGHYKLTQYLLKTGFYSVKTATGAGDNCLLLAVKAGRPDILQLLFVKDLSLDHHDLNLANDKSETALAVAKAIAEQEGATDNQKKCYQILQAFQTQQRPSHTTSGAVWIRNFRFYYGNKKDDHPYLLDLNSVHDTLRNNLNPLNKKGGNNVTAAVTLIISQGPYASGNTQKQHITVFLKDVHNRDFIEQLRKLDENFKTIGDKQRNLPNLKAIQRRLNVLPPDFPLSDDAKETNPGLALSAQAAEGLFKLNSAEKSHPNYEQHFHHSEQHLLKLLDNIQNIQTLMAEWQQDQRFKPGCKVFAVILSIHSLRYVCADCTAAIVGEQNLYDSGFLKLLAEELTQYRCQMPSSPLRMITTVSSQIPPYATNKKQLGDHQELVIDLRCNYGRRIIFERDAESTTANIANMNSGVF